MQTPKLADIINEQERRVALLAKAVQSRSGAARKPRARSLKAEENGSSAILSEEPAAKTLSQVQDSSVEGIMAARLSDSATADKKAKAIASSPPPSQDTKSVQEAVPAQQPDAASLESGYCFDAMFFDAVWYLIAYPDVGACGMDAVEHFMTHGYLEGRDPNAYFSVARYMEANPDIPLTINPFLHFIMHGAAEGRRLRP